HPLFVYFPLATDAGGACVSSPARGPSPRQCILIQLAPGPSAGGGINQRGDEVATLTKETLEPSRRIEQILETVFGEI
ncbi:hypothetical protein, partial [Chromohalobacter sp. HP20-39]|uniref:hypothetical protein n=1 Tax=Chromohalobacter sp. HP20-39 TaxID=3079306 RepID=UPI00294B0B00